MNLILKFILSALPISFVKLTDNDAALLYKQSLEYHLVDIRADTVRVLTCSNIELPRTVGKHEIIQNEEAANLFGNRKSIRAVKLMPIEVDKGNLVIVLVDYAMNKTSNGVRLHNEGSELFKYSYDARSKKYKLLVRRKYSI